MTQLLFWPALCAAAVTTTLYLERIKPAPIIWRRIAAAAASFSYMAFFATQLTELDLISAMILVGAAFAALGDQLLVRRGALLQLMFGVIAFVFMHLFYAAAISSFVIMPANLLWSALAALLFVITVLLSVWRYFEGVFRYISAAYLIALSLNIMFCMGVAIEHDEGSLLYGIVLFSLSDLLVAGERIIEHRKALRYLSLPSYMSGQYLILYGCVQLLSSAH